MGRRNAAAKREILPDPLFKSELIAKFINCIMSAGKKSIAEKIVYGALEIVVKRTQAHDKKKSEKADVEKADKAKKGRDKKTKEGFEWTAVNQAYALEQFDKVIEAVSPRVEVKSRRVGGATYQVPVEVRPVRRLALAMRWIREYARKRGEKTMVERLGGEMVDILSNRGGSMKKLQETIKMADANKAFAHIAR